MSEHPAASLGFHGPKCWGLALAAGLIAGTALAFVLPKPPALPSGAPNVSAFLATPFLLLLLSIALMPFINVHFWEHHYPDFAFLLGGVMVAYYSIAFSSFQVHEQPYGTHRMIHVGIEYFQFIALVGSLYVVSGGVLIDIKGTATPRINATILGVGAVIANVFGTTGAAVLLIRSYIRVNKQRIRPFHIVLFIFIVANCGGALTPIGDPPLFLGYLQGVPFTWTLIHCFPAWALSVGLLLAVFYGMDTLAFKAHQAKLAEENGGEENAAGAAKPVRASVSISGRLNFVFLGVILFGVFLDQLIHTHGLGACLQIAAAAAAYKLSQKKNLEANEFNFGPILEVAFLFVGLFATMVPALDYLGNNATSLGINTPSKFYWATGILSSFLDNAPTYLNFLQAAHGLHPLPMGPAPGATPAWMALKTVGTTGHSPAELLLAISIGSVFFGANTYIGNAPNFMVKAIAEASGVRMPTFLGYMVKFSLPILLLIILPLIWLIIL